MKKTLLITIFSLSLLMNLAVVYVVITKNPMKLQGQQSWIDLASNDADATTKFLDDMLGINVVASSKENEIDYRVIQAKGGIFPYAGVMQICDQLHSKGVTPGATIYITVDDYEAMHQKFTSNGAVARTDHMKVQNMEFGIYTIPGGLDVGIVQYK